MTSYEATLVKRDLLLLENQLPFRVIRSLLTLRFGKGGGDGKQLMEDFVRHIRARPPQQHSFKETMRELVHKCIWPRKQKMWGHHQETADHQPVHLLGLLHANHIHKEGCILCSHRTSDWYSYHSTKYLRSVGFRFRPNWTNAYSNVEFQSSVRGGKIVLPSLTIDDSFKSMLLNLIAYETKSSVELWVTSYACFLDSLIRDVEDVKVLQSEGVLNIFVLEQEVADLFNQMSRNLVPDPYAYSDVKRKIELDHKNITKRWVAEWLQNYFSSPWSFIALLVATLTIILTATQTFMQIFSDDTPKCCPLSTPAKGT